MIQKKIELNLQKNTIKAAENSLRHVTPKIINDTPSIITDKIRTHSLQVFTSYIKQHFINSYTFNCNILDCLYVEMLSEELSLEMFITIV